ncbi:hypothetical protein H4I87_22640 [Klebsiella pneumoniae]|nr:hypothetical protein [Klebsiella pneumoniae]
MRDLILQLSKSSIYSTKPHEGDKLSGLSIYIKYFAYFANNLFLHIVIRLFIFGFHHFEI